MERYTRIRNAVRVALRSLSDQAKLTLLITLLVGGGLVLDWASRLGLKTPDISQPRILMARRDLSKGTVLSQTDLTTVLGSGEEAEKNYTDQQLPIVLGSTLRLPLRKAQRLGVDMLEAPGRSHPFRQNIPNGYRAYSFVPENDLPIEIGDRVDLLASGKAEEATQVVASGAEVLNLRRGPGGLTLVVAIPEEDLTYVEKARKTGNIVITLRGEKDKMPYGKRLKNSRTRNTAAAKGAVQIFVEGEK